MGKSRGERRVIFSSSGAIQTTPHRILRRIKFGNSETLASIAPAMRPLPKLRIFCVSDGDVPTGASETADMHQHDAIQEG